MKFVKRISLFFIYPLSMFAIGFGSHMAVENIFYPGPQIEEKEIVTKAQSQSMPEEVPLEASALTEPVVTADTSYMIVSYDAISGEISEQEEVTPDKYIGLTRQELEAELKEYGESPSLTDLEKGFSHIELLSFSPSKVVIRKNYEKEEGFFLINENHKVVVYDKSLEHMYMDTGILTEDLPKELQDEIIQMKYIEDEMELYHFLESYSS